MNNWYKQKTLLLLAICSLWSGSSLPCLANSLEAKTKDCSAIDSAYQHIYGFETESYYINICQLDNEFYYHRQSKLDSSSSLILPATSVFRGSVYQATSGKVTYFVGMDSDRYYSSVMLNDNEIIFEPELEPPPVVYPKQAVQVSELAASSSRQLSRDEPANASLELDSPEANAEQALICVSEKSALHPRLQDWQQLIGESTSSVNRYAENNGHNFTFDTSNPQDALITTQSGMVVNLGIAVNNKTVERVCVEPTANNVEQ